MKSLINYTKEAFALPINLAYLLGVTGAAIAAGFIGLPSELIIPGILAGGGLELLYLAWMPNNKRFQRAVQALKGPTTERISQQVQSLKYLSLLDKKSIDKYTELYRKKNQLADLLVRQTSSSGSGAFLDSYLAKVNSLEVYYVQLLYDIDQYSRFLNQDSSKNLELQRQQMESELAGSNSSRVQELYRKRIDLLGKRKEKNLGVQEQLQMAQIQLATLEDTVNYLLEQSITINSPEEISRMIDQVIGETEDHYQSMLDIQSIRDSVGPGTMLPDPDVLQNPGGSQRQGPLSA